MNMINMREKLKIKIGEEFKPAPQFKKLYYIYLLLAIIFAILWWYLPVLLFTPFGVKVGITIPILAILIFIAYWIPKYYDTIVCKLTEDEIVWRRGVWFKNTGIVPYNGITNIDIGEKHTKMMLPEPSLAHARPNLLTATSYILKTSSEVGFRQPQIFPFDMVV